MERENLLLILKELHKVCEEVNRQIEKNEPENPLRYEVLQFSELAKEWNSVHKIVDFYNENWIGNKDFMHIPNFETVRENCKKYPIIVAREVREDITPEILGISTMKYKENTPEKVDPYFPEEAAKYFSMTGVLVKKGNPHRGIGKKIYEIAIRGAYEYNKYFPGIRLMTVIDCRNKHSLNALSVAVENINDNELVGQGKELPADIVGYYEIKDEQNGHLVEAPTLILEVGLDSRDKEKRGTNKKTLDYKKEKSLFESLKNELKVKFTEHGLKEPIVNIDEGCGRVYYYSLFDNFKLHDIEVKVNGTEEGNDRNPVYDKEMHEFIGPIEPIYWEER